MRKNLKISVIWSNRKQSLKECTEDIIIFLECLKMFDLRLSNWFEQAYSRKEGMKNKVHFEYEYIRKQLCRKCSENEYPEFSFLKGFWNGAETESLSSSIRFSIGGEGKLGTNNCVLNLPYEGEIYEYYKVKENWENLLNLFIDHWKPDKYRDFEDNLIDLSI